MHSLMQVKRAQSSPARMRTRAHHKLACLHAYLHLASPHRAAGAGAHALIHASRARAQLSRACMRARAHHKLACARSSQARMRARVPARHARWLPDHQEAQLHHPSFNFFLSAASFHRRFFSSHMILITGHPKLSLSLLPLVLFLSSKKSML